MRVSYIEVSIGVYMRVCVCVVGKMAECFGNEITH